jgi:maleylpyruvate isomerase
MDDFGRTLNIHVAGCAESHQRLLQTLDLLTDDQCREPSALPGWTRGHVLSHLARNAESHVHVLQCAARGEVGEQYVGGAQARKEGIETHALDSAESLIASVRKSIYALEGQWAATNSEGWQGNGVNSAGATIAMSDIVFLRWREVEVHHADLALDFTFANWNSTYVRMELDRQVMMWRASKPMGLTPVPKIALQLPPNERLAWFLGRTEVEGLPKVPSY